MSDAKCILETNACDWGMQTTDPWHFLLQQDCQ